MKKRFLYSIALLLSVSNCAFANIEDDMRPMGSPAMRYIQESAVDRNLQDYLDESEAEKRKMEAFHQKYGLPEERSIQESIDQIKEDAIKHSYEGVVSETDGVQVFIKEVRFTPSEVFSEAELQELVAPLVGQTVTLEDIKKVVNDISRCYVLSDYITSRAYLPSQDLNDGILTIGLFEGKVGDVILSGNKWTRDSYVKNRISEKQGDVFKLRALESDIVKFNNNNDIKLNAKLAPGREEGTTDIILRAKDPIPFHVTGLFDNAGRYSIGTLRGGVGLATDSLTGNRDRAALGAYFGRGTQIAYADYSIPINKYGTKLGGSFSYNHVKTVKGMYKDFDISGNAFVYSVYLTHPWIDKPDMNLSTYTAANFKLSDTYFSGISIYDTQTISGTQGITFRKDTKRGIWYTGQYATVGDSKMSQSHETFFKYEGNLTRLHDFGHGIIGQLRGSWQYSPNDLLPWIEQFQAGGISSVRGYSEGLLIGRTGYFVSGELITPIPFLPKQIGTENFMIPLRDIVKFAVFIDQGCVFPYKGIGGSTDSSDVLLGTGVGLRINVKKDLVARLYWGLRLIQNKYETNGSSAGRFHFELTSSPDLERLLNRNKHESI